jgi:NitT/TauT family transport system ATP-binding protein
VITRYQPTTPGADGTDALVRISQLTKTFRTRHNEIAALAGIDLNVARGEFVCVVGPSGCGKTTLLNIVGGLESPTSGSVHFSQVAGGSGKPLISMVFQEQGVFPWMTVLDNAAFGLMARGVPKREREQIARGLLARVGLSRFAQAYPRELSGGMRQRVNIVRAFANDPELLLMDEPFANLDEQTRLILQNGLLQIWEEDRKTVLFITHSLDEAVRLGDRVVLMTARPGRIKADVPVDLPRPRDVFDMPANPDYQRLYAQIWEALREEVLESSAQEEYSE